MAANAQTNVISVLRKITNEQRSRAYSNARKYDLGVEAAKRHYNFSLEEFVPRFVAGEFDNDVHNCCTPEKSGRYWPWFKAAQQDREDAAAAAAAEAAAAAARSAQEAAAEATAQAEAELAKQEAAMGEAERQKILANHGIMQKLQEAHRQRINHMWQKRTPVLNQVSREAGEMVDRRQERRNDEASQQGMPVEWLGLKTKTDALAEIKWHTILPAAVPKVVVVDLAIAGSISEKCMQEALHLAGLSGTQRQEGMYVELGTATARPYHMPRYYGFTGHGPTRAGASGGGGGHSLTGTGVLVQGRGV